LSKFVLKTIALLPSGIPVVPNRSLFQLAQQTFDLMFMELREEKPAVLEGGSLGRSLKFPRLFSSPSGESVNHLHRHQEDSTGAGQQGQTLGWKDQAVGLVTSDWDLSSLRELWLLAAAAEEALALVRPVVQADL
jgi:hypothetical protein